LKSHNDTITILKANLFSPGIFTGFWTGEVHYYHLSGQPTTPLKFLKHNRAVTSIEMLNDFTLVTSSADGRILFWDLRNSAVPMASLIPDQKALTCFKVNRRNGMATTSTLKGCYGLDISTLRLLPITPIDKKEIFTDLSWNEINGIHYAANTNGQIVAHKQNTYRNPAN